MEDIRAEMYWAELTVVFDRLYQLSVRRFVMPNDQEYMFLLVISLVVFLLPPRSLFPLQNGTGKPCYKETWKKRSTRNLLNL